MLCPMRRLRISKAPVTFSSFCVNHGACVCSVWLIDWVNVTGCTLFASSECTAWKPLQYHAAHASAGISQTQSIWMHKQEQVERLAAAVEHRIITQDRCRVMEPDHYAIMMVLDYLYQKWMYHRVAIAWCLCLQFGVWLYLQQAAFLQVYLL